jgi:hypothetical protein
MDVRGIAEQEGAPVAETISDAMVHAIGRKPVHLLDIEFEVLHGFALHVVETEFVVLARRQIVNGSNETPVSVSFESEEKEEIGVFDIDVDVAMDWLARSLHIGNVEETGVRSARKPDTELSANG